MEIFRVYDSVYCKYLRMNVLCKNFHMCLTVELFYHGSIYFGTNVLWNMLWESSDFNIHCS